MGRVHVMGTGTIGEPLIALLADHADQLGIDRVSFYKHTPRAEDRPRIQDLVDRGAVMAAAKDRIDDFEDLGLSPEMPRDQALDEADVVVDAGPGGVGMDNKRNLYEPRTDDTAGFLAQGSEAGFGTPYALGVNDAVLDDAGPFLHIVSCNTHNIAVILRTLGFDDGQPALSSGRFVCFRRGSDVTDTKDAVPAPRISLHDSDLGTHHAEDVHELYGTLDLDLDVFSSALKTNTQYMHTIWYEVDREQAITAEEARRRFRDDPLLAVTDKTLASAVFAYGRDHGYFGRILDQTVACLPSITTHGDRVVGFCFTPQDGNALLSNVAGVLHYLHPGDHRERIGALDGLLLGEV